MTRGKKHKSKMYEKFYGKPYEPKKLITIKVCRKCGRELPQDSKAHACPFCQGTLIIKVIPLKA